MTLKPCPFCGAEAKLTALRSPFTKRVLYWYACSSDECGAGFILGQWSEEEARNKWNRRAEVKEAINE